MWLLLTGWIHRCTNHHWVYTNALLSQTDKWLIIVLWCSENSDSNSSSSDGSRARSVQSSATHAPAQSSMVLDSDEPRRSFGIKVQNLPVRSTGEFLHGLSKTLMVARLNIFYIYIPRPDKIVPVNNIFCQPQMNIHTIIYNIFQSFQSYFMLWQWNV